MVATVVMMVADTLWKSETGGRKKNRTRMRQRREREAEDDGGHRIEVGGAEYEKD